MGNERRSKIKREVVSSTTNERFRKAREEVVQLAFDIYRSTPPVGFGVFALEYLSGNYTRHLINSFVNLDFEGTSITHASMMTREYARGLIGMMLPDLTEKKQPEGTVNPLTILTKDTDEKLAKAAVLVAEGILMRRQGNDGMKSCHEAAEFAVESHAPSHLKTTAMKLIARVLHGNF